MGSKKSRLDQLLCERGLAPNIKRAQAMILAGEILIDDTPVDKAGSLVSSEAFIRLRTKRCPYVSRGGLKLAGALQHFNIKVEGVCIDIGASTGGFTDCLLQKGAEKVYAVDVAYGQLAWKIRQNPRVTVLERFNARNIKRSDIDDASLQLAVMDASFISLTTLLSPVASLFVENVSILALIKPQFELPRHDITEGGVVTSSALHTKATEKVESYVQAIGLKVAGIVPSQLLGPKGNKEFLIHIIS